MNIITQQEVKQFLENYWFANSLTLVGNEVKKKTSFSVEHAKHIWVKIIKNKKIWIVKAYIYILYFMFLFSLFVFVSAAGQYNVIWTRTGLPRFRFGSGTVPALLF